MTRLIFSLIAFGLTLQVQASTITQVYSCNVGEPETTIVISDKSITRLSGPYDSEVTIAKKIHRDEASIYATTEEYGNSNGEVKYHSTYTVYKSGKMNIVYAQFQDGILVHGDSEELQCKRQ